MTYDSANVANVLKKLAAFERLVSIPGATPVKYVTAFDNPPDVVQSTDMPAFINLPGPMIPDYSGGSDEDAQELYTARDYYAVLIIAPFGTGIPGEKYAECLPYIDSVRNLFCAYQALGTGASQGNALRSIYKGDTGVRADIQYAGQMYYGIRFTLTIYGLVRINYAKSE